jgi:hypothetical protein
MKLKYKGNIYKSAMFYSDETGKVKLNVGDTIEVSTELGKDLIKNGNFSKARETKKEVAENGN